MVNGIERNLRINRFDFKEPGTHEKNAVREENIEDDISNASSCSMDGIKDLTVCGV